MRPAESKNILKAFVDTTRHLRGQVPTLPLQSQMKELTEPFYNQLLRSGWPPNIAEHILRQAFAGWFDQHF